MTQEELKIIDDYEEVFVTNKDWYLKQLHLSTTNPNKKEKSSETSLFIIGIILNIIIFYLFYKVYKNDFGYSIFITLMLNFGVTPIPAFLCMGAFDIIKRKIWVNSQTYKNNIQAHTDSIIHITFARNIGEKFINLTNETFQLEKLKALEKNSFESSFIHLKRVSNLYFTIDATIKQTFFSNSSISYLDTYKFAKLFYIRPLLTFETFETFLTYTDFFHHFNNRIGYWKGEISRRRVHHTILAEINWACEEFFRKEKTHEKLSQFYKCFNEEEINLFKLDYIKNELEELQKLKQKYQQTSFIPKPIERTVNTQPQRNYFSHSVENKAEFPKFDTPPRSNNNIHSIEDQKTTLQKLS